MRRQFRRPGNLRVAAGLVMVLFAWSMHESAAHQCAAHDPLPTLQQAHSHHDTPDGGDTRPGCCCIGQCCPAAVLGAASGPRPAGHITTRAMASWVRPVEAWPAPPSELLPFATPPPDRRG